MGDKWKVSRYPPRNTKKYQEMLHFINSNGTLLSDFAFLTWPDGTMLDLRDALECEVMKLLPREESRKPQS